MDDYAKEANRIAENLRMKKSAYYKKEERKDIPPINKVIKFALTTEEAAFYLLRKPQTLRMWSCTGNGPISPIRICGRLAWKTSEVKALLGIKE